MACSIFLPSGVMCAVLLCFGYCISSTFAAVRIQTISEAREELLSRQARATAPTDGPIPATTGTGIFGNDSIIFNTTCFLLETTGVKIVVQDKTKAAKNLDAVITSNSSAPTIVGQCKENNGTNQADFTITFNGFGNTTVKSSSLRMLFNGDRFNWILSNLTLDVSYEDPTSKKVIDLQNVSLNTQELFASLGTSYYCLNQRGFQTSANGTLVTLYFGELIMQPFVNGTHFDPIENCEYAFGIGIWMGILTALIMAVILGFGISMLASIRNMDRFDDPKTSKLLSVPNE